MAEFKRTDPAASFTLPERLTFQQKLEYDGEYQFTPGGRVIKAWAAVRVIMSDWSCAVLPDPLIDWKDLEALPADQKKPIEDVILWAAASGLIYVYDQDRLPKP